MFLSELNKIQDADASSKNTTCQAVKSSSDSKLSKTLGVCDKKPAVPSRSTKPIHFVPEYLQKPIHVDSGVDSSGGCHTPDETPSPVIPPREFTPKVMSGSNGTGTMTTSNREYVREYF